MLKCDICGAWYTMTPESLVCPNLKYPWHINSKPDITIELEPRYDTIYWSFIRAMAQVGTIGVEKYGLDNYKDPKNTRNSFNHILEHCNNFIERIPYDHTAIGTDRKYHLAAIAFNAMIEYYHEENTRATT